MHRAADVLANFPESECNEKVSLKTTDAEFPAGASYILLDEKRNWGLTKS